MYLVPAAPMSFDNKTIQQLASYLDAPTSHGQSIALKYAGGAENSVVWVSRERGAAEAWSGRLEERATSTAVALNAVAKIIFFGDRTPYLQLVGKLDAEQRESCTRETFDKDCRMFHAEGLYEEQEWCERAFENRLRSTVRTGCIVRVEGSERFFAYFNFTFEESDFANLKSCHYLNVWVSTYVPILHAQHDVTRWVFLEAETYYEFCSALPDYRTIFIYDDFPIDSQLF